MNTGRLSLFLNLVGVIAVFLLTQLTVKFAPEMMIPILTLIILVMMYYFDNVYKYTEGMRQSYVDKVISNTQKGYYNITDAVAKDIYEGIKSKKEIKQSILNGLGRDYKQLADDLYCRGWRLNYPHFLDKFYYLKISAIQWGTFVSNLVLALILVVSTLVYKSNIYIISALGVGASLILLEIYSQLWVWNNYRPVTFPFYQTVKSIGFRKGIRLFILHYLINCSLSVCTRSPIKSDSLKSDSLKSDSLKSDSLTLVYSNNYQPSYSALSYYHELVISKTEVVLHSYSRDPREPHVAEKYKSFNEFFKAFITERIVNHNYYQVVKYPNFLKKTVAYYASKNSPNESALLQEYWDASHQLRQQHCAFYKKGVARFMMTPRYLLLRLFL